MEAATLWELLHKLNAKVWLWFVARRDGKKGWEIDRGRFKAEIKDRVYYDGPSTEPPSHFPAPPHRTPARLPSRPNDAFASRVRRAWGAPVASFWRSCRCSG